MTETCFLPDVLGSFVRDAICAHLVSIYIQAYKVKVGITMPKQGSFMKTLDSDPGLN